MKMSREKGSQGSKHDLRKPSPQDYSSLPCPICGAVIPAERWNLPEGVPSCFNCSVRLQRSQENREELEVVAQIVEEGRLELSNEEKAAYRQREDQSEREGELLEAFCKGSSTAIKDEYHRTTIRQMEGYKAVLASIRECISKTEHLSEAIAEPVAVVLCAAKFWDKSVMKTDGVPSEGYLEWLEEDSNGPPVLPLNPVVIREVRKSGKKGRPRLIQEARKLRRALRRFHRLLKKDLYRYRDLHEEYDRLMIHVVQAVRKSIRGDDAFPGVRIQESGKKGNVLPHNFAAAKIMGLLEAELGSTRAKKLCAELISVVFPERKGMADAAYQAHYRTL